MICCCGREMPVASFQLVKTPILIFSLLMGFAAALFGQASGESPAQKLVSEALVDFEAKKFDDALVKLLEAEKLDPNSAFVLNLIGAAYTKKQDFAMAKTYFEKSLALDSTFFPSLFNIGELFFLQKQYPQALDYFARMLNRDPGNELLQFKVVLCLLLTDQPEEAEKLIKRMKYPGEGPSWYYSQAAVAFKKGDKGKSRETVGMAKILFPGKVSLYDETFTDLGWPIK